MRKRTDHLDPAAIKERNARILDEEKRRLGENFLGPQMTWHRKPNAGGGPCDVCGCPGLRLGVRHRALEAGHDVPGAVYVKTRSDATGDTVETYLGAEGGSPRVRHVGPGEPPPPGAKVRHVGPRQAPSLTSRERLMLAALGHIAETVRRDGGDPDPWDAMEAVREILTNHGIGAGDVESVLASKSHLPRVRLMLEALKHIVKAARGDRDPFDALSDVIAALRNHGIDADDVDKVLR
jgi:hypothetical protein